MRLLYIIIILLCNCILLAGQSWTSGRPDGHAPIGVMGDHTHSRGEFMFSYRYMSMDMAGMRSGTDELTSAAVLDNFTVTPLNMPMDMHMIGMMYAVSDQLTLVVMAQILSLTMDHVTRAGGMFTTESDGFGDLKLAALYRILDRNNQRIHLNLGLSIPTGSIDQTDVTPASAPNESQLPYPMQLGTGTWDLSPGLTYLWQSGNVSGGAQVLALLRLGENDREYMQGASVKITPWIAYNVKDWVSFSLRLSYESKGEIDGADPTFGGAVANNFVPTVFPENFGGSQVFSGLGFNFYVPNGALRNVRLGLEYEFPLLRDINGPQLEVDNMMTVGAQYSF